MVNPHTFGRLRLPRRIARVVADLAVIAAVGLYVAHVVGVMPTDPQGAGVLAGVAAWLGCRARSPV